MLWPASRTLLKASLQYLVVVKFKVEDSAESTVYTPHGGRINQKAMKLMKFTQQVFIIQISLSTQSGACHSTDP